MRLPEPPSPDTVSFKHKFSVDAILDACDDRRKTPFRPNNTVWRLKEGPRGKGLVQCSTLSSLAHPPPRQGCAVTRTRQGLALIGAGLETLRRAGQDDCGGLSRMATQWGWV